MKALVKYIKPYWIPALIAPLCMMMEVFMDVLQPKYMALIVDHGVLARNANVVAVNGAIMIGITLIGLITGVMCNVFASIVSQNFGADVRKALFSHVQTFSYRNLDRFQTGSLITRMTNDIVQVQNLVQMAQQMLVRAPGLAIGSLIMALTLSVHLGVILLISIPILALFLFFLIRVSYPLFGKVQTSLDGVNMVVQEDLAGIRVVKAFVQAKLEIARFTVANQLYTVMATRAARVMALNTPVMNLIMNLSIIAVLWYGGHAVWHHTMPLGNLIAFINYVTQVLSSLMMVSMIMVNVSSAKVSADRISEVLTTEPDIVDGTGSSGRVPTLGRITFDDVSFSYGEAALHEMVLRNVSFTAEPGKKVGIVGSTGAGKSSLVNLISRLYDVTSGQIRVDGEDIRTMRLADLRKSVAMVLQESILFTGSILENIAFGRPDASEEEIRQVAMLAQADDFIASLPEGYDTVVGQRGVNLSGGQKQRIAIARALLMEAPILVLDDSTSALDLATEARLQQALASLTKRATTLLIAQRISSVLDCDKILVLEEGRLVGEGNHASLMATCAVYQDIYASQQGRSAVMHG